VGVGGQTIFAFSENCQDPGSSRRLIGIRLSLIASMEGFRISDLNGIMRV